MYQLSRNTVRALVGFVLAVLSLYAVAQQSYPSKQIRIIVPLTPGGSTDSMARLLAEKLRESWGQSVIVENHPGANTIIGTELAARSAPDGYTLLVVSNTHDIIPLLKPNLPYDPVKSFVPVATLASARFVMLIHPSVPVNNLQQFIALAKSKPGQLNFGSSGSGSGAHIAGEVFDELAGVQMQHIPYKGGAQSMTDAIGGQVQVSFNTPMIAAPYIKSGQLKALAVSGKTRLALLPQVPTFSEAGLPAYDERAWQGVFVPAGTPRPIVEKLSAEIARILTSSSVKQQLEKEGVEPLISTPDQFAALINSDTQKLSKLVKSGSIKLDGN
ncbi:tripartite-type tricarboxylate transporter receptor subunit TctC [Paraburkholderia sp. RAU6.4a]|uniref:tripartite tricarboxylate transporter substrate binding protein n=1 Tax=Paraburkholderia sp. RAU6.4a TaxID=2991067 RepID=UPI003D1B64C8